MSERSVHHNTLVVERHYGAAPARVFAAWSDPLIKAPWFAAGDGMYELDFRVGRQERSRTIANNQSFRYEARYSDIVAPHRIVYSYEMYRDTARMSVSLATIEFIPNGTGTRLVCTEQGAFLDGLDTPTQREGGLGFVLDRLGEVLR